MPDGSLLVSSANRITKVDPNGRVSTFVEPSGDANAVSFDAKGRLIAVERAVNAEKVGVLFPERATLVDRFEGKPFNRLNDLVVSSRGGIYFTDTAGVYYLSPEGKVARVAQGIPNPNGVILPLPERQRPAFATARSADCRWLLRRSRVEDFKNGLRETRGRAQEQRQPDDWIREGDDRSTRFVPPPTTSRSDHVDTLDPSRRGRTGAEDAHRRASSTTHCPATRPNRSAADRRGAEDTAPDRASAESAFGVCRVCANRQHREGRGTRHDRRRRPDGAVWHLPRSPIEAGSATCPASPAVPRAIWCGRCTTCRPARGADQASR